MTILPFRIMVGVERIRHQAKASFTSTISGTDLIVGARSGPVQLLLYSVFRIGNPTNNIAWRSWQAIAAHPKVAWAVPLSLGDSHRGYRVLGTTLGYFEHLRFARDRGLRFAQGHPFSQLYDAGLGAEVAEALGYGRPVVITTSSYMPEVAEAGAGLVVPPEMKALTTALGKMMRDEALRNKCALNAIKLAKGHFTWDAVASQTLDFYRDVIQ